MTCGRGQSDRRPSDPRNVLHRSWRQPVRPDLLGLGVLAAERGDLSEAEHLLLAAVNRAELEHDNVTVATALHQLGAVTR